MKKHNILLQLIVLFLLFATACENFLEEVPKSSITASNYYGTEEDADAAVIYAYQDLTGIYGLNYWLMAEFASDNLTLTNAGEGSPDSGPFGLFSWDASTTRIKYLWSTHYNAIANVNAALEKIPGIDGDATYLNQLMGELYFLRGLYYYNLVRFFGDVPIILKLLTTADDLYVTRDASSKVYEQVINDLTLAIDYLPDSPLDPGRADVYVAKTLLAKVYQARAFSSDGTSADYEKIISLCEDIIANSGYDLIEDYQGLFKTANKLSTKESIFEVQFADQESNLAISYMNHWFLSTDFSTPTSVYQAQPSDDLVNTVDPKDKRAIFIADTLVNGFAMTGGRWLTKYQDVEEHGLDLYTGANYYVLRYPDVLLMYAEAQNELNGPSSEAINAVNAVRNRAGLDDLSSASVADKDAFSDAILKEMRVEFIGEGHRWFDLVRTGRLVSTMQNLGFTNVDERRNILPIPQAELDENPNMTQNTNY